MDTAFTEEEEGEILASALPAGPDRELTLSTTTLLVIFFGLVLVCGLFFGLGYSLGRRDPGNGNPLQPNNAVSSPLPSVHPKPSATAQNTPDASTQSAIESAPSQSTPAPQQQTASAQPEAAPNPQPTQPASAPATQTQPQSAKPAGSNPPVAPQAPPAAIMVQIAAVSDQADAQVLLSALHKRGYTVSLRHEPGDSLMHVQIGPFASKADASAMRQKLLNDGYNAILR